MEICKRNAIDSDKSSRKIQNRAIEVEVNLK